MEKTNYLFIIFCFLVVSGCISDNGAKPVFEEHQMNFTPIDTTPALQNTTDPGDCSSTTAGGLQEPFVEFLEGDSIKKVNYTFLSQCPGSAEVSCTLVPVNNWNDRDPVDPPDWVHISIDPSSFVIPSLRTNTSEVTIRLTRNTTDTSATGPSGNRAAFFYLKPSINSRVLADAEDWLCVQENYNYRSLHRPQWDAEIENNNLVVHPGTGNQTPVTLNTQSQGLDYIHYEIQPYDNISASVLEDNLLLMSVTPSEFSSRSFRNYTSVLSVNANHDLPPGIYQFTVVIHGKILMELPLRIENTQKHRVGGKNQE